VMSASIPRKKVSLRQRGTGEKTIAFVSQLFSELSVGWRQLPYRRTESSQLIRNRFAVVFAVSPPLIEAGLKFEQIVRNVIHRIPPKIRSGMAGNDSRNGAQKSGAIAESEALRRKVRGSPYKPATLSMDDRRRDTLGVSKDFSSPVAERTRLSGRDEDNHV
jgi:hypothetical protein